ncbi:bifunctional serine/threonine-protein kinase/formylglycine-generating enzyme family protein [Cellvibrio fontiphilus]|uniref:Bifunctional serine/threonine-protein kinase/formylglycine-generating enzyme family protein n=1 Tax=Cellvibrio fontiphilus TaxID=1815559 RepID=A0ABV7FEN8_9GAMM
MALQIPGYRVVRKINQGGMSTVYLAIQISVGRVVALKVMNPQLNNDPAFSERFQREATIVGQLSHPNIVAIYDIGRHEDLNYIAMDYLPNGSVHDRMSTGLTGEEVLRVIREVASALDHAHEKGYVHRDIKPENILFRTDNSAVLSDFGVARGVSANSRMTHVGTVVGTPHYMSPEQTKGNNVDGRSDLYSLGIVFYEMLTGSLPYQGEEAVTIALKHISAPIPKLPLQYLAYQKILDKLLAKDPEQRFQRGRDLIQAIDELEKNFHTPLTSSVHPTDLTVIALARALVNATVHALRWRWNKLRALRWSPERGFYARPSSKITEIFFNEGQSSIHSQRTQIATRVNGALDEKHTHHKKLAVGFLLVVALLGLGVWWNKGLQDISPAETIATNSAANNTTNNTSNPAQVSNTQATTPFAGAQPVATAALPMANDSGDGSAMAAVDMTSGNLAVESSAAASSEPLITFALQVKTVPAQARVRVLNIPERYQPGMQLPPGSYHLEVSHPGYDMQRSWVEITDQDLSPSFTLNQSLKPGEAMSSELVAAIKSQGPEMVRIPSGSFLMGHKDTVTAMPVHKVTINKAIAMSKYEITFDDYDIFAQATNRALPSDNRWGRGNRPVINVNFEDARAYAKWLSETTGKKYRLPTEAEWEYVARANSKSLFWWGDDVKDAAGRANCRRGCNSKFSGLFGAKTAPVGSYPANAFGIYDTAGNVAEWVEDCFADNYNLHPKNGQALLIKNCDARVVRGGSAKDNAERLASHIRDYHHAEIFDSHLGFRVVMDL